MPERSAVVEAVVTRIADIIPEAEIQRPGVDQDLRDFAGFDSLGILELLVWLESEFSITIPDEELVVDNFTSVGKMADYVIAHQ
jgi:D-alanine--poly(phosphoribitol) ligase subunit 2